jgi:hypothetical protein
LSANMRTQEMPMHVLMTKSRFGVISNLLTHHPSSSPSPNACHGRMAGNAHQLVHIYSINISIPSRYCIFVIITFCLHPLSEYIDDATFSHNILIATESYRYRYFINIEQRPVYYERDHLSNHSSGRFSYCEDEKVGVCNCKCYKKSRSR